MSKARRNTPTLDQLALRWIKSLPSGDPNTRKKFAQFVRTSPEHLKVYLKHKVLDVELKALDPERQIDATPYIAQTRCRGNVIPWDGPERDPLCVTELSRPVNMQRPAWIGWALCALVISSLVMGPLLMQWQTTCRNAYITAIGQHRHIQLPDGSQLQLNTRSTAIVDFSPTRREVKLVDGEAMFTVHHDRRRPFRVRVGNALIEDLGTEFNVRVSPAGIVISVIDGRVNVLGSPRGAGVTTNSVPADGNSALLLQRFDEALLPSDPKTSQPRTTRLSEQDVARRVAWTHGVVTFHGQTLLEAVAEVNRYNQIRLEVIDPDIMGMRLGGSFNPTDLRSFVSVLEHLGVQSDGAAVISGGAGAINLFGARASIGKTSQRAL